MPSWKEYCDPSQGGIFDGEVVLWAKRIQAVLPDTPSQSQSSPSDSAGAHRFCTDGTELVRMVECV